MMPFNFEKMRIKDAYIIDCFSVGDLRGGFSKIFEKDLFFRNGIEFSVTETFASVSSKNVIRGLHFQLKNPQAKIVSVISGKAWDVIVDLRKESESYRQWAAVELSAENHKAVYVPRGFAHGFVSLEDNTTMLYHCDGVYDLETDTGIRFDDPNIGIKWPIDENVAIHSKRDMNLMSLAEYEVNPMRMVKE